MAIVNSDGRVDLRTHIETTWSYIELRDASAAGFGGAPIGTRISTGDTRVVASVADPDVQYVITITGSDAGFSGSLPQTIRSAHLYTASTGGNPMASEMLQSGGVDSDATLSAAADQVTITFTVTVPDS